MLSLLPAEPCIIPTTIETFTTGMSQKRQEGESAARFPLDNNTAESNPTSTPAMMMLNQNIHQSLYSNPNGMGNMLDIGGLLSIPSPFATASAASSIQLPGTSGATGTQCNAKASRGGPRSLFPTKLRNLLDDSEQQGQQHLVCWLSHGKAFKVHKPKEFASQIITKYFNHGNYRSFTRQLYHYGFTTVDCGSDMGAFYHPNFLRDHRELDVLIERKKVDPSSTSTTQRKEQQKERKLQKSSMSIKDTDCQGSSSDDQTQKQPTAKQILSSSVMGGTPMLESSIQALGNKGVDIQLERASQSSHIEKGINGLLDRSQATEQISNDRSHVAGQASNRERVLLSSVGPTDETLYLEQSRTLQQDHPQSGNNPDWMNNILGYFDQNNTLLFDDAMMHGGGLEPRPIEQMRPFDKSIQRDLER